MLITVDKTYDALIVNNLGDIIDKPNETEKKKK